MSTKLPPEFRVPFMEYGWMGCGLSQAQVRGVRALLVVLDEISKGPDGGLAEHALRVEAARRKGHASILGGSRVPPCDADDNPNMPDSFRPYAHDHKWVKGVCSICAETPKNKF